MPDFPRFNALCCSAALALVGLVASGAADVPTPDQALAAPAELAAIGAPVDALTQRTLGGAWTEGRLRQVRASSQARIAAFARRYGIAHQLSRQIYETARSERVDLALAYSLVKVESGFDPRAVGPSGSIGLTQLQPRTARGLAPNVSQEDLYSPRLNLTLGFRYLRAMLERFNDRTLALSAYNRGPGHVESLLSQGRTPRTSYARKVLRGVEQASGIAL